MIKYLCPNDAKTIPSEIFVPKQYQAHVEEVEEVKRVVKKSQSPGDGYLTDGQINRQI